MKCKVYYGVYRCELFLDNLPQDIHKKCPVAGPFESHMECTVSLADIEKDFSKLITFSVQFGCVFEEAKTRINKFYTNCSDIPFVLKEYPVFFIKGNLMIGISAGQGDYVCVFEVTWVDAGLYDYNRWFVDCDFDFNDDFDAIYSLYRTVKDLDNGYEISINKSSESNDWEIHSDRNKSILKLREEDREDFMKYLDGLFELGIEGEEAYRKAMERND